MSSIARQRNRLMLSSFKACSDASFQTEIVNPDANPTVIGQDGSSVALPSVQAITLRSALPRERFRSMNHICYRAADFAVMDNLTLSPCGTTYLA